MLFKPVSWITNETDIIIIGYNDKNQSIMVEFPLQSTYILQFDLPIEESMLTQIMELLEASDITISTTDPSILVVRGPQRSVHDLNHNRVPWFQVKRDPYGSLQSLWAYKELGPYEWLYISNYVPIFNKNSRFDMMIRTREDCLEVAEGPELPLKLLFWDLQVYRSKLGIVSDPQDYIFMISVITTKNTMTLNYLIYCGSVDFGTVIDPNITLVKVNNELEVIQTFFTIYSNFNPDWQIHYNGSLFKVPYLLERMRSHKYKSYGRKDTNNELKTVVEQNTSPYGGYSIINWELAGLETVDLLQYFERYYSELPNYHLNTIIKIFGKGIIKDSYLNTSYMKDLFDNMKIQNTLNLICNNLGINMNCLLKEDLDTIIDRVVYNIEPGIILSARGPRQTPLKFKKGIPGIYRDIFEYDYSELYRLIMVNSDQPLISKLGDRLFGAPTQLIVMAFYSSYVDRSKLKHQIMDYLTPLIRDSQILSIDTTTIRTRVPISYSWLSVMNHYPGFIQIDSHSYIVMTQNNNVYLNLLRTPFELVLDMIVNYVTLWFNNKMETFVKPPIGSHKKLLMDTKIRRLDQLSPDSLQYKLTLQYNTDLTHEVSVTYLMTTRGPILESLFKETDVIDTLFYDRQLDEYLKILHGLKEIK
jgi:hypothetical protein